MSKTVFQKQKKASPTVKKNEENNFPIVAIGASAGGLTAVSELLKNLSPDTGMAFIYVQHLNPDYKSRLPTILSKFTKMKVQEIDDMELMKPNNIYVIPNNKGIKITGGYIKLFPREKRGAVAISIDALFSSLALTHKENVMGVVLSGYASDGTIGLKAIKEAGGITFAQDSSAEADSMPHSAIASGVVDFVLSPKEIARQLTRLSKTGFIHHDIKSQSAEHNIKDNNYLKVIFQHLQTTIGADFSHYKMTTIKRRLNHRMVQCGAKTIREYTKRLLAKNNNETELLYKDLLINVTDFFRDTEIFKYLKSTFLPKLLKAKGPGDSLRIWIPACSSGEEAYSIAMMLYELQEDKKEKPSIRIFATDLSDQAIHVARIGEYSRSDLKPLTKERIKRFFTKSGDHYRIIKEVREMCVFAPHNILRDPPFFRLDFVSCRNLLIYFDPVAQKKALATINFALNDEGYLMLGKSETTGASSHLFTQVNKKFKIYSRKKDAGRRKVPQLAPHLPKTIVYEKHLKTASKKSIPVEALNLDSAIDSVLLSRFMPACAVINKEMEIIQFRGLTSLYLSHPSGGKANLNILKMTRPEFSLELRNAIHQALKTNRIIRKSGIEIKIDSVYRLMSIEVSPLKIEWSEPLLLIIFTLQERVEKHIDAKSKKDSPQSKGFAQKDRQIKKLTEELNHIRAEMHSIIEAQEAAYEELQAANEEIVSTNEEFQTLNEELETSKEEIESTNEELISTNQELKMQNDLLAESYQYSEAIIATIHEPMLVLDNQLCIKSANTSFYKMFRVNKAETEGIPLFELGNKQWEIPKLHVLLENILTKDSHFENLEVEHVFPRIGEKVMLLNASRIIQKSHREQLILLAIQDITERSIRYREEKEYLKKDIREHKAGTQKLIKQRESQYHFLAGIAHDLRNPLNAIALSSELLSKNNEKAGPEFKSMADIIKRQAKQLNRMVGDLLDRIRVESGNLELKLKNENICEIIMDSVELYRSTIEDHELVFSLPEKPVFCPVDALRLGQVTNNFLSNAIKYSPEGGTISVKVEVKKNQAIISVSDQGIGIKKEEREQIFEPFRRTKQTKDSIPGVGLGLSVSKRIVEAHGGRIEIESQLKKGSTFYIYLPLVSSFIT